MDVPYFRLNIVDEYNNGMGNVDQADQLRLQYRIHYWLRNRKWWWAIFFWAFEFPLTNAYILFRKFYKIHEREPPFSHYEFVKKIALAWLKRNEFWPSNKSKKNDPRDNSSTIESSIASSIVAKRRIKFVQRKNSTITDKALDSYIGNLRCRLDTSLNHLPEKSNKPDNNCELHYWFDKTKCRAQLMRCLSCNVILCISCYKSFYEVPFLKNSIKKKK